MRWTLDEPNDYELLKIIYDSLYKPEEIFLTNSILAEFKKNPEWLNINQTISRNAGYQKSLVQDEAFLKNNH